MINNNKIDEALDIEPDSPEENLPAIRQTTELAIPLNKNELLEKVDSDISLARRAMIESITVTQSALESAKIVAESSDSPRAFEVVGQLIKTLNDNAKELIMLRKHINDIYGESKSDGGSLPQGGNITNNLYVGSTADLLDLIADTTKDSKREPHSDIKIVEDVKPGGDE